MKKFLPVILLIFGLGIQSFASTSLGNFNKIISETETLEEALNNLQIVILDKSETDSSLVDEKDFPLNSDGKQLLDCWIVDIQCSCDTYTTQYCNEGLHGNLIKKTWFSGIFVESLDIKLGKVSYNQ